MVKNIEKFKKIKLSKNTIYTALFAFFLTISILFTLNIIITNPSEKPLQITQLTDSSCNYCITPSRITSIIKSLPKKQIQTININSHKGKELLKKYQISFLPAYLFSKEIKKQEIFKNITELIVKQDDGNYLSLYGKVGASKTLLIPAIGDDYILGDPKAPLTLFMFGDFECEDCGKFARETFPKIKKEYIDAKKINFVFKDSPDYFRLTNFGERLVFESLVANCAGEQQKYWDAWWLFFNNQENLAEVDLSTLNLTNQTKFIQCTKNITKRQEIGNDIRQANMLRLPPARPFFIFSNGAVIAKDISYEQLKLLIEISINS